MLDVDVDVVYIWFLVFRMINLIISCYLKRVELVFILFNMVSFIFGGSLFSIFMGIDYFVFWMWIICLWICGFSF